MINLFLNEPGGTALLVSKRLDAQSNRLPTRDVMLLA
jgi:hypothetical protein